MCATPYGGGRPLRRITGPGLSKPVEGLSPCSSGLFITGFQHMFPAFYCPHAFSQVIPQSDPSAAEYWVVGPHMGEHSCLGKASWVPPEVRVEACEHFLGSHSILGGGRLVKVGTSAVSWEGLQDAWAIKGGMSPTGPIGPPGLPGKEEQNTGSQQHH